MSIHWLTIFLLLADFILINSDGLSINNTDVKNKQWINAKDVYRLNGGSDLLSFDDFEASIEPEKIPILLSHQVTKNYQRKENKGMFSRRMDHLIVALSKIAKVRSFEEDPASIKQSLMTNIYNAARNGSAYLQNEKGTKAPTSLDTKLSSRLSSRLSSNGISDNLSSNGIKQENFYCRAIRDVYIPEIKKNVPSYACTSGGKTFILSSKRFFQDRRSNLHVNIDDDTLRKLNDPVITLANNRFNVIPAILILKPGHENYNIRNQQNVILRKQQTIDDKNNE